MRSVWTPPWVGEQISILELKAVHLALKAILPSTEGRHVLIRTDSFSTMHHINYQGGNTSLHCLQVAQKLLFWAFQYLASLRAINIPGVVNRAVDLLSRTGPTPREWRLYPEVHTHTPRWRHRWLPQCVGARCFVLFCLLIQLSALVP